MKTLIFIVLCLISLTSQSQAVWHIIIRGTNVVGKEQALEAWKVNRAGHTNIVVSKPEWDEIQPGWTRNGDGVFRGPAGAAISADAKAKKKRSEDVASWFTSINTGLLQWDKINPAEQRDLLKVMLAALSAMISEHPELLTNTNKLAFETSAQ